MQGAAAALPELIVEMAAEEEAALLVRAVLWIATARQLHCGVLGSFMAACSSNTPLPVPVGHAH